MEKFKRYLTLRNVALALLLFVGVGIGYLTVLFFTLSLENVVVSNRTDRSATISWVSKKKESGVAIAYKGEATLPIWISRNGGDAVAYDDRDLKAAELEAAEKSAESVGESPSSEVRFEQIETEVVVEEMGEYYLHHVTFTGLEPETEYEFLLGNGVLFKKADVSSFKTFEELDAIDVPEPAYGIILEQQIEEGFSPASPDSVVYIQVEFEGGVKSQALSSVTAENGSWYIDLSVARGEEGEPLGKVVDGLKEIVSVEGGPAGSVEQFENFTDFDAPMKPMILGEEATLQSKAPLDFFASEVHAACCNSFVCSTGESYGDDPTYGGGDCNTRHAVCGGTENVVSQGSQCGASSGSGGSGTTPNNNSGGNSSTGTGSCEGVSISCPAGWNKENDVYCENGSNTCKLKCVKQGESDWWHEGGACSVGSEPPASGGTTPPPSSSGSGGANPTGRIARVLNRGEECAPREFCLCLANNTFIDKESSSVQCGTNIPAGQEGGVQVCHQACSDAQPGVNNSHQCLSGTSLKSCCNEGYQWDDQNSQCVSANLGGSPPVASGGGVVAVPAVPIADRTGEGLTWLGDQSGLSACNANCNGSCNLLDPGRNGTKTLDGYLFEDSMASEAQNTRGQNDAIARCNEDHNQECIVEHFEGNSYYDGVGELQYKEVGGVYYMEYEYVLPDGSPAVFGASSFYMCVYNQAPSGSEVETYAFSRGLSFAAHADGGEVTPPQFLFDPRSETYYVGEAGEYILEYEGEEYRAIVQDSEQEVLLYIDQNLNGLFDEGVDVQIVEEPVQLNISQVSKGYEYELNQGFNFVHFPFVLDENNTAASLLEYLNLSSDDSIYSISKYDGTWKVVGGNGGDFDTNDFQIVPGVGYLIRSKSNIEFTIFGKDIIFESEGDSAPVFLSPGWNLMGIYGTKAKTYTAESLIDGINGFSEVDFSVNNVSSWSVAKGRYEGLQKDVIDAEESAVYGFDFPLNQKSAYFVRVTDGVGNWEPEKN